MKTSPKKLYRLKSAITLQRDSFTEFADEIGIKRNSLYGICCGNHPASEELKDKISALLGQPKEYLFEAGVK